MERRIYFYLSIVASFTAILTSFLVSFFIIESNSYIVNFMSLLPVTVALLVVILILLNIVSYFLTKFIMKPIDHISKNIENFTSEDSFNNIETYSELKPLIKTMQEQKYEIEKYISQLEEMDKYRKDFTANITHELKTPLTSINGFAELLSAGLVNEEDAIKFGNIIYKEGNRLLSLIDSILNLSSIEVDKPDFELLNIKEVFLDIYQSLNVIANKHNISMDFEVENIIINGNKRMIKDLLYNLIHNSIKYNKVNGSVFISIRELNNQCIIRVKDSGIGIKQGDIDKIFNRFYTVEKSRNKNTSGTGLGLSIVKHIVNIHHGYISIDSELGYGTTISVSLPIN